MDKSVITFLLGAGLASGIFYVGTRKSTPTTPAPVVATNNTGSDAKPSPTETETTSIPSSPAPQVLEPPAPSKPAPVQPAPSRTRETVRHQTTTTTVARNNAPAMPAPVATQAAPAPAAVPPAPEPPRQVAANTVPEARYEPAPPPPPKPNSVTIAAGTPLNVRLGQALSTEYTKPGDSFTGTLDQPLIVNGFVIAERGSRVEGRVVESGKGGRVEGLAELKLELTRLNTSDGQRVRVSTEPFARQADPSRKQDAEKIGGGAALGAIIGAIAGGGKGAAIGAGAGGAGGTGVVLATRGKQVTLPVESRVSFHLSAPLTLTEQLH